MEKFNNLGLRAGVVLATVAGLLFVGAEGSFADTPTPDSYVTGLGATVTLIGGAMLGVIVIAAGIVLAAKYIKKAASKA